ncbi:MAG: hypothetical protein GY861_25055 [bacterium]|nr:hypothetical protein [bacterium]
MTRRTFLQVTGTGAVGATMIGSVGADVVSSYELGFRDRLIGVNRNIMRDKIHPIDGLLILSDLKEENKKLFVTYIKKDENFQIVVHKCSAYILDADEQSVTGRLRGDGAKNRAFRKLQNARAQIPLKDRPTPNFGGRSFGFKKRKGFFERA